jgi:hypothetical protein
MKINSRNPEFLSIKKIINLFFIAVLAMAMNNAAQSQSFTQFKFTSDVVGWENDFIGEIDDIGKTITFTTQQWIENIDSLPATFTLDDVYEVKVGDFIQTSGVTKNDFRKNIVYTVNDVEYTVIFISPQASGLPVIHIKTVNGDTIDSKENWTNMQSFVLTDAKNPQNNISKVGATNPSGTNFHRIRGRGNTTWGNPKKPYRIRFRENVSLFGHAAYENWVLLAEYSDPTFLTTPVTFELGRTVFDYQPYTLTYQHVHLYINSSYNGLYGLTEHRQASPDGIGAPGRVGIDPNEGWFVEMDSYWDEAPKFKTTNYELPIMIKSPEAPTNPENSNDPAYDFIKNDLNTLCDLLASEEFPESGYRDSIDVNTFLDFLMINDIVRNIELQHPKSTFAYKDKDGKISMGPLWDFDYAFAGNETHLFFQSFSSVRSLIWHGFFLRFFEDPVFLVKYKERWNEKLADVSAVSQIIDELGEKIRPSVNEDSKRWAIPGGYQDSYPTDHANETERMKTWWNNRVSLLNVELNKVEVVPANKNFDTVTVNYSQISPQIFTLVAYGEMNELEAKLKNGILSDFEIVIELNQEPTGDGGYLASISVMPKDSLFAGTYNDKLMLSGENQGNDFSLEVPLSFTVNKGDYDMSGITFTDTTVIYDGMAHSIEINGELHQDISVSYEGNAQTEVGSYEVKAIFATTNVNYNDPATMIATMTIEPESSNNILKPVPSNPLRAWIRNGLLYVAGLTAGETINIYSVNGALLYHNIVTDVKMEFKLWVHGVYIVLSDGNTVRAVFSRQN